MNPEAAYLYNEREVIRSAGRQAIATFLDSHTCFSVMRASAKVVVFDVRIPIQFAFYALVEHGESGFFLWIFVESTPKTCDDDNDMLCIQENERYKTHLTIQLEQILAWNGYDRAIHLKVMRHLYICMDLLA